MAPDAPARLTPARLTIEPGADATRLVLAGPLHAEGTGTIWRAAIRAVEAARGKRLTADLTGVSHFDMAGAAFLLALEEAAGAPLVLVGAPEEARALLDRARKTRRPLAPPAAPAGFDPLDMARAGLRAAADGVAFLGEATLASLALPARRRMLRLADILRYADHAGVRAMPLILMLGFLIGVILAFQSAVPMRRFGADLYVANLVSISLLRELGPLLAAVILAGRTGSAFAAEIGTMKVNEEVDALVTMGLDPMTMLVLPRMLAVILVMPAMIVVLDLAGLAGMTTVMMAFGYPLVTIANQVQGAAQMSDLIGGLSKGIAFGIAVAAVGCRSGLGTGIGPRAVGEAATAAVVGGIVVTILLDGLFAFTFYRLGL
jgi:phospholipid/cholesterol/gamma-HCH transport system permease protein